MSEQLIKFKTAKLAKKLGFSEINKTSTFYGENGDIFNVVGPHYDEEDYYAPTQTALHKWLREKQNIDIIPPLRMGSDGYSCQIVRTNNMKCFKTYEEALENELFETLNSI